MPRKSREVLEKKAKDEAAQAALTVSLFRNQIVYRGDTSIGGNDQVSVAVHIGRL